MKDLFAWLLQLLGILLLFAAIIVIGLFVTYWPFIVFGYFLRR